MELIYSAAEEAFLHIGSMIGVFILIFGFLNYKTNGSFTNFISNNVTLQPLLGAIIGSIPGCGGSLAIMPLYIKGNLSFGAIVASLIASLGDSAFILISTDIKIYLFVTIICFVTGVVTGYVVDSLELGLKLNLREIKIHKSEINSISMHNNSNNTILIQDSNHFHGTISKLAHMITHEIGYKFYIAVLIVGFVFMMIAHSNIHYSWIEYIHSIEEIIAIIGVASSIMYMYFFKKIFKNSSIMEEENKKESLRELLIHSVGEISFIITWIFVAYVFYDLIIYLVGGEEVLMTLVLSTGIISVIVGALLGVIPGCGIQIILMSFYLKGAIPFAVLIANSISQDGDALFPLIAMDKKSSLWATIVTTIPAIVIGSLIYFIML